MSNPSENDTPWEPAPIAAEAFHRPGAHANINGAPYDDTSGVIYKRAAHIKRVRYTPADCAPEMPAVWQGQGAAVVRWLFSEQPGTEEGLLQGASLEFLHDTELEPGAATGMRAHPATHEIFYVLSGAGELCHRPTPGSPVIVRALRPGDAALVRNGEYHSLANRSTETPLRLIVIGLKPAGVAARG